MARALHGDPKLLILDEPNSNLDGAGENALAATLAQLRGKVTVVVVTHRSTLIQHVDKMLVLEGGRVQHYGTAAEVMKALQGKAPAVTTQATPQTQSQPRPQPSVASARVLDMKQALQRANNPTNTSPASSPVSKPNSP